MNTAKLKNSLAKKSKGIGLIELLLVIAVIAVIIMGALMLYNRTNESNKAMELEKGATTIAAAVQGIYGQQPTYAGVDTATIASSGALPEKLVNGAALVSPYGTIGVTTVAPFRRFVLTYAGVPRGNVCTKFVSGIMSSVESVTVNGAATTSTANIITNCNAAPTPDIVLTFE